MRRYLFIITVALFVLCNSVPVPAETSQFDGTWNVTYTCEPTFKTLGYTYNFVAQVKDGMLLGHYGNENKPNYFRIEGKIEPDGSSILQAAGNIGKTTYTKDASDSAVGRSYVYTIKAEFKGSQGTGSRMQLRKCDCVFVKQ